MGAGRALLLLGLAALGGCKLGPDFVAPREPVPEHYAGVGGAQRASPPVPAGKPAEATVPSEAAPEDFWWREFHDAELDRLIGEVRAGNLDLKVAYLRIVESRLQVASARAQGLPSLNASASYTREQLGLAGILKAQGLTSGSALSSVGPLVAGIERPIDLYTLGFDASWELDLFGKVRRSVEAANAQSLESLEARNDLLVSLEAEVAQDYLEMRAALAEERILDAQIRAQREVVELTAERRRNGLATESDLDSARAQLSSLESQRPSYEQSAVVARHALAVLSGAEPERLDGRFGAGGELPALPAEVPVGVPSTLARRRPDIRGAEAALHAATAQVGVSVAELFPSVSLSGTYGLRNIGTRYLFDWSSRFYTAGPSISLPIFQGGRLLTSVKLARTQAAEAAFNYRKTVLGALQEIEDALNALAEDATRTAALRDTVAADERALEVDLDAYRHGIMSYLSALTVQLQTVQAQQQLEQAMAVQRSDLVKLYKALGGGWETAPPAPGGEATAQAGASGN